MSPKLRAMVHNGMKESRERQVDWGSEEVENFCRFGEYAFSGTYDVCPPKLRPADEPLTAVQERNQEDQRKARHNAYAKPAKSSSSSQKSSPSMCFTKLEKLRTRFLELYPPTPQAKPETSHTHPEDDYTDVFLAHGKGFFFAEYHGIEGLKRLSLEKLSYLLDRFQVYNHTTQEFVELLKSIFDHPIGTYDQLREVLVLFSACNARCLNRNEDFKQLLTRLGFASELLDLVLD